MTTNLSDEHKLPNCTVADLRAVLEGLPDDAEIQVLVYPPEDDTSNVHVRAWRSTVAIEGYRTEEKQRRIEGF